LGVVKFLSNFRKLPEEMYNAPSSKEEIINPKTTKTVQKVPPIQRNNSIKAGVREYLSKCLIELFLGWQWGWEWRFSNTFSALSERRWEACVPEIPKSGRLGDENKDLCILSDSHWKVVEE